LRPEPVRLGHITTLSLHPSINTRVALTATLFAASPNAGGGRSAQRRCAGGGGERIRTDDLLLAKQALSQLSYTPMPEIRKPRSEIRSVISDL
jgi:hypothetical protein